MVAQRPCEAQEREEGSRGGIPLLLASEIRSEPMNQIPAAAGIQLFAPSGVSQSQPSDRAKLRPWRKLRPKRGPAEANVERSEPDSPPRKAGEDGPAV